MKTVFYSLLISSVCAAASWILTSRPALAADYLLQAHAVVPGDSGAASRHYRLEASAIGEGAVGPTEGESFRVSAGFVPFVIASPPEQGMTITNLQWDMGGAVLSAFSLDSVFFSPEGQPLFYWVTGNSTISVEIDPTTHWVSFSQPGDFSGLERVRFAAGDPEGNVTWSGSVALLVRNPSGNNPPVLSPMTNIVANEGDLISLSPSALDADGDPVSYSFTEPFLPDGTWQTGFSDEGTHWVTVTASDGHLQDSVVVRVTVQNVNRRPEISPIPPITITAGESLDISPKICEPDGQLATTIITNWQSLVISPEACDPDGQHPTFAFWPPLDANGHWQTTLFDGGITALIFTTTDGEAVVTNMVRVHVLVPDSDADGLNDLEEMRYGTDPHNADTDGDGLSDSDEVFVYGTDPLKTDTDGDGMTDGWEVAHGLNPLVNDANADLDGDAITNLKEYQMGFDPSRWDSNGDGISDYRQVHGTKRVRYFYDKNDRLIGAEYDNGLDIAYFYDANGDILRQVHFARTQVTRGAPDLWRLLNGLTNGTPQQTTYSDADKDGWSNYQEWMMGTDPQDTNSTPDLSVGSGNCIATLQPPFAPANWVVATGQLDGYGAQELVVGADGNADGATNTLFILTQEATDWSVQRLDVGAFGITSIVIAQPTNRPSLAIYLGLRQGGGSGRIVELNQCDGVWQMPTNSVAVSTAEAAWVHGVRTNGDLLATYSTNGFENALFALASGTNGVWTSSILSTNSSTRGLGSHGLVWSHTTRDAAIRLLDSGGVEIVGGDLERWKDDALLPSSVIYNPLTAKWYFQTSSELHWDDAQAYFQQFHANLVTISSAEENAWVNVHFPERNWIGWYYLNCGPPGSSCYVPAWISGAAFAYDHRSDPDAHHSADYAGVMVPGGYWVTDPKKEVYHKGIGDVAGLVIYTNQWLLPEPGTNRLVWRGLDLLWRANQGDTNSVFCAFVDDKNLSGRVDAADEFVLAQYRAYGNDWWSNEVVRAAITSAKSAPSYAFAFVNIVPDEADVLFTGEPDGQVFALVTTNTASPWQRRLFTAFHAGTAWQAMTALKTVEPGEALVGLCVNPTNQCACDVIFWPPQCVLQEPLEVPQTAPLAEVMPSTNAVDACAMIPIRLWDAEGNAATPFLQFRVVGTTNWQNAAIAAVDGAPYTMNTRVEALPSGSDHVLTWNAGAVFGTGTTNYIQLKVQAQDDLTLLGDWSSAVDYTVVNAVNTAPVLPAIPDQVVAELAKLVVTNTASDADLPANTLTYELLAAPEGATISTNGIITWTPTEAQGPSTNLLTMKVTDDGVPPLGATNSFSVTVMEVNSAPVLAAVGDQKVDVGRTLRLRAAASDPDIPPNSLTFTLDCAPQGMGVDVVSGELLWTPTQAYLHTTNEVVLRVTDDGTPRLSATNRFTVAVLGTVEVRLAVESYSAERLWLAAAGPEGITIALESSTNLAAGRWTEVVRRVLDGSVLELEVPLGGSQSYYRAVIVSP